ncbi:MerR family transcriptional regulator [Streptomyces litchfieldiae]|uniref:MerR family transcriptional regulator n=1 Tax=Streptomyces litchfieldiae TaxID=3075543 RepID=A0ABU2MIE1_9ACTN|nr:MerR family transcriptional regulator [Streptomyces sp. DSM 44938]MDT0341360.1 MerR family transcriptional regulator [Streptomyces sp. DSM 44938]
MRIGDLARATGVSRRLLRYYEEQGLLRPARDANGYRAYADTDVATVRHIRALLDAGLTTAVIARVLACVDDEGDRLVHTGCPGLMGALRRERGRVTEEMARLRASGEALDTLLAAARHP